MKLMPRMTLASSLTRMRGSWLKMRGGTLLRTSQNAVEGKMPVQEPIGTYEEARFELRRRFELFPDHVRVTGKGLRVSRFDETVSLANFRPQPNRMWVRGLLFRVGFWIIFFVFCFGASSAAFGGVESLGAPGFAAVLGTVALVGLIIVILNARPIEFARFPNDAGVVGL